MSKHPKPLRKRRTDTAALVFVAVLALGSVGVGQAETPEEKGRAIAEEVDRRDLGFGDSEAELKMLLTNKQGETSTRELRMQILEVPEADAGDKALLVFDHPRDIEGTAFLSFTRILEPDDQWLYLPALKRVKRISSANKSGSFVGSEFAYEDLLSQEVDKYNYRWLRDEPCGTLTCFVIERYPLYENSGYVRQIAWIDQQEYRVQRIDFYDRKDALLKGLTFSGYNQYLDQYWRADDWFMENHQTGKTTRLTFDNWEFRTGITANDLDPNRLNRLR
ncbi:MAG: outer membrane lipoprotein-sorting protein [Kiloniellaceae bacterium]